MLAPRHFGVRDIHCLFVPLLPHPLLVYELAVRFVNVRRTMTAQDIDSKSDQVSLVLSCLAFGCSRVTTVLCFCVSQSVRCSVGLRLRTSRGA
jgi:hypothetical protein